MKIPHIRNATECSTHTRQLIGSDLNRFAHTLAHVLHEPPAGFAVTLPNEMRQNKFRVRVDCGPQPKVDADETINLGERQKFIAKKAKLIIRALAHVGIIALVDEATGYQEVRNKEALRAILDAFLRQELAAWAKRFPDEFYREMFRLRGWEWQNISTKRPILVGKLTNDLVYERLAPDILEELEQRNPKNDKGRRKSRHHQWLTDDVGHPALAQHLHAVIGITRASDNWPQFHQILDRAFPKRGSVLQLELIEI